MAYVIAAYSVTVVVLLAYGVYLHRERARLAAQLPREVADALQSNAEPTVLRFRNPENGSTEEVSHPGLWTLLFGSFYFALRREWAHALASFIAALLSFGLSWLVYPFFAHEIMRVHYLKSGWEELN